MSSPSQAVHGDASLTRRASGALLMPRTGGLSCARPRGRLPCAARRSTAGTTGGGGDSRGNLGLGARRHCERALVDGLSGGLHAQLMRLAGGERGMRACAHTPEATSLPSTITLAPSTPATTTCARPARASRRRNRGRRLGRPSPSPGCRCRCPCVRPRARWRRPRPRRQRRPPTAGAAGDGPAASSGRWPSPGGGSSVSGCDATAAAADGAAAAGAMSGVGNAGGGQRRVERAPQLVGRLRPLRRIACRGSRRSACPARAPAGRCRDGGSGTVNRWCVMELGEAAVERQRAGQHLVQDARRARRCRCA